MRHMKEGGIGGFEVATVYPLAMDDPSTRASLNERISLAGSSSTRIAFASRKRARARPADGSHASAAAGRSADRTSRSRSPRARLRSERREIAPGVTEHRAPGRRSMHDRLVAGVHRPRLRCRRPIPRPFASWLVAAATVRSALPTGARSARRALLCRGPDRSGREARGRGAPTATCSITTTAPRSTTASARSGRSSCLAAVDPGSIDSRVLRQPRGLRRRLDHAICLRSSSERRGYDLRPLLPIAELGSGERADTVRRDYGRTLTELFEERFLAPMHAWAAKKGVRFRIQNYGVPPATLASCRHADVVRRRRIRVASAVRRAMGLVRVAPVRQAASLPSEDVDVAAFARVPRDAARSRRRRPISISSPASTS